MKKVNEVPGCQGCPLCVKREITSGKWDYPTFVEPRLGRGLRLAITEAPRETDSLVGEPLSGGSGNWLRGVKLASGERAGGLYSKCGVKDRDITYANIIQCRPPHDFFPTSSQAKHYISREDARRAIEQCKREHLGPLLKSRPWERVDVFGDDALRELTGKPEGVMTWRGGALPIPELGDKLVAISTLHPKDIAKNQKLIPAIVSDLRKGLWVPGEDYELSPTLELVRGWKSKVFALDIETGWPRNPDITMVGLCGRSSTAVVVPFRGPYVNELRRIIGEATDIVGHNLVHFDQPYLEKYGCPTKAKLWDTMLMHHLIQPDLPHDLEFVASIFSNKPPWKHGRKESEELYNARDVDVTWQIYTAMRPILEREGLAEIHHLVSVPTAKICKLMNETGFKMDTSRLTEVRRALSKSIEENEGKLPPALAPQFVTKNRNEKAPKGTLNAKGKPIKVIKVPYQEQVKPWRSNDFLKDYLYVQKGLPIQLHPKTKKPTVGRMALERLQRKSGLPEIKVVLDLRDDDKLLSTFCKEEIQGGPGEAHPHFNTHGTATGRLSSADPNFQNIPSEARVLYVPHVEGWRIMDVDYAGIENRLTAYFAGETELLKRMEDPEFSEHKWMTELVYGIPYAEVNKKSEFYKQCKIANHGTNYGMGFKKLAQNLEISEKEAKELLFKIKGFKPAISSWQLRQVAQADSFGFLQNPFGRKRWSYKLKGMGPKMIATIPQGTAADVILRAMIGLMYERIGWPLELAKKVCPITCAIPKLCNLLVQCHDSLVFEYHPEVEQELIRATDLVMTQPWKELGGFSLPISRAIGLSWGECK